MIVELIFRIINPIISNETDKTRTGPGPAVLFHLTWIFAGMNLIDQLLSKCKPSTSSSTDETVSEFTLDSELPPTPPPKTKAKRAHKSKPRNPLLPPCYIHTAEEIRAAGSLLPPGSPSPGCPSSGLKWTAKNKKHATSPTGHSARGPGGVALLGRPPQDKNNFCPL
jgi:hypothetical protein